MRVLLATLWLVALPVTAAEAAIGVVVTTYECQKEVAFAAIQKANNESREAAETTADQYADSRACTKTERVLIQQQAEVWPPLPVEFIRGDLPDVLPDAQRWLVIFYTPFPVEMDENTY